MFNPFPFECSDANSFNWQYRQLLEALDFLRSINLIHTDLKLENVLLRTSDLREETVYCRAKGERVQIEVPVNPQVKLIDFGGATYEDAHKATIINTRQYRAPEVLS